MILFAPPTGGKLLSSTMKSSINDLVGGHVDPYLSSRHRDATRWTAATGRRDRRTLTRGGAFPIHDVKQQRFAAPGGHFGGFAA